MSNSTLPSTIIIDPDRGYREWLVSEIYDPAKPANGLYVPNVNDSVRDWDQGIMRVIAVDYTTGISTLKKWTEPGDPGSVDDQDILLGAGPGTQSESYRCYLDTSVMPHTLSCDARLRFYGTTVRWVKIFLGTDISSRGTVISAYYDTAGNLLGENIPVELVRSYLDGIYDPGLASTENNIAVKRPMVGHTTKELPDGEVVTVVAYDAAGQAISQAKLLIKNSAFIRQTDASLKYVASIAIETPFLLGSDPTTIEYPINMPVDNLGLIGVVTYSDGSQSRLPVDGTKFQIAGLRNYVATIQGQTVDLLLTYQLGASESAYLDTPAPNGRIAKAYHARTKESDGAYSVKLFGYPTWVDALTGYRMEYYLYNLDRQQVYRVTNLVTPQSNMPVFDPILIGTKQYVSVGVNMQQVDPLFDDWRHTQMLEVTLLRQGNQIDGDNWTVGFTSGKPAYGAGVKALGRIINVGNAKLDISCGVETLAEWLALVYTPIQPLYNSRTEPGPLDPNFMVVVSGNHRVEVPIASWDDEITVEGLPGEGKLIYLEFIRRTADNDLQLGAAGMIMHQQQNV
ncbi:hypothetical protein LUCX_31 [Xanthomonas phage vB_XciM_LucasX]|nr:hypothetical protein LUCX_31 [Xanthomonas phage vB_XciM_LucasX]